MHIYRLIINIFKRAIIRDLSCNLVSIILIMSHCLHILFLFMNTFVAEQLFNLIVTVNINDLA
jgi:hypothetical protein